MKPDTRWDFNNPGMVRTYVQQILTYGRLEDVRLLLKQLPYPQFHEAFLKLKPFLPRRVSQFWEAFFASH
jgi:hypothetical protein